MIISSMDLFFNLDCGGGGGPEVDAPKFVVDVPVVVPRVGLVAEEVDVTDVPVVLF